VKPPVPARLGGLLAGLWAGLMAGLGGVAATALFEVLPRADAGRAAARFFSLDATIGVVAGGLLAIIGLQIGRERAERGAGTRFGFELMLPLAALLCIVIGYYALLPMMEAARSGQGSLSFGALHGIAAAFFGLRLVLVVVLAWRLAQPAP
jgi:hypothetical protein